MSRHIWGSSEIVIIAYNDPIKQIVDKIFCTELLSVYCLVILILFAVIKDYNETSKLRPLMDRFLQDISVSVYVEIYFLVPLFIH